MNRAAFTNLLKTGTITCPHAKVLDTVERFYSRRMMAFSGLEMAEEVYHAAASMPGASITKHFLAQHGLKVQLSFLSLLTLSAISMCCHKPMQQQSINIFCLAKLISLGPSRDCLVLLRMMCHDQIWLSSPHPMSSCLHPHLHICRSMVPTFVLQVLVQLACFWHALQTTSKDDQDVAELALEQ